MIGVNHGETAVRALSDGAVRPIDAIAVSCTDHGRTVERFALLYAAVGFAAELGKCTTPLIKRVFGPRYCYSIGFFRALLSFEASQMRVRCDDQDFEGPMFLVSVGNAEVVGGGAMRLSPGAKIDDGRLNVNIVRDLGRFETARCFPRLVMGTHTSHPKVSYVSASSVRVESRPDMEVQIDGELFGRTPVSFRVRPKSIRVCTGWGLVDQG